MEDQTDHPTESLLPYDSWMEQALRQVMLRALQHVADQGLPGGHHFYITFNTTHPGVAIPPRLKAQYPGEMTIVIQHQFWDLVVDEDAQIMSIGLSFGGVPAALRIPFAAISAFADPFVRHGMRFSTAAPPAPAPEPEPAPAPAAAAPSSAPQVVSLDAFRRRPTPTS
jgi:hypothetical protein